MIAVKNNNLKIAQILLEEGKANTALKDKYGKRAIDRASTIEMLELLRSVDSERIIFEAYGEPTTDRYR